MYYTIYKITNLINNKFYIGSHKTKNIDDNYMGSGKYLKYAQKKYGIENFKKDILFVFETAEEMFLKESEIVNEEFISDNNTYNIKVGGIGGFQYIINNKLHIYNGIGTNGNSLKNLITGSVNKQQLIEKGKWEEYKNKISNTLKRKFANGELSPTFKGKIHTDEVKKKIGILSSKHQTGDGNSQFGTMWITDGINNRKIKKNETIPNNWSKGRKIK